MQAVTSGEKLTSVFRKTSFKIQGNAERGRPGGGEGILGSKTQLKLSRILLVFRLHTLNETEQINIISLPPSLFLTVITFVARIKLMTDFISLIEILNNSYSKI